MLDQKLRQADPARYPVGLGGTMDQDVERIRRVRDELASEQLDGVICQVSSNVLMLTHYAPVLGQSFAIVPTVGEPTLIVPDGEDSLARASGCADVRVVHQSLANGDASYLTIAQPVIATVLAERGLADRNLGFEGSDEVIPSTYTEVGFPSATTFEAIRRAAPGAVLTDVSPLLALLRARTTPREVRQIQVAGGAASVGLHAARTQISHGTDEFSIATTVESAVAIAGRQAGAHRVRGFAHVMSGSRSERGYLPFNLTGERFLQFGDPVLVQLEVYADGYWVSAARTFFVGDPGAEGRRIYEACREAQSLALDQVRDGAAASDVDAVARNYIDGDGFGACFLHELGHGVGFSALSRRQPPRLYADSTDTLRTDMVFSVEPGIYVHGWGGVRIGDTVATRASGADFLTRVPRDLAWAMVPQRARM